ncbi:response regulator [Nocardioides sp.]|uniref:response regulator n=1 Tax=Nocardioides sp. TaxID=35761 RepID=UPI00271C1444|nr:response regulator [Nocardioides sp.]MDO9454569.1 response regulator [Nocardioides sp.]
MNDVRVLVVEDDLLTAQAHATYVERIGGFVLAGVVHSAGDAARALEVRGSVDLVLLDMNLPDGHGLGLLQRLRAAGDLVDVIAVTAARETEVVRRAMAHGVSFYLLKPFTFATFRSRMEQYAEFRARLATAPDEVVQDEVDRMLGALRPAATELPKGMSAETLRAVVAVVRESDAALSASEVATAVGASRVTARRYLEHLAESGMLERGQRYGTGRPEVEYRTG